MILGEIDFTRNAHSRIHFAEDALAEIGTLFGWDNLSGCALVADSTVFDLHGPKLLDSLKKEFPEATLIRVPPGEEEKNLVNVGRILDQLAATNLDRKAVVFALGGGVLLDMAGFAAASHLRGVSWVSLPTTLLAQVDAGIGGKTGVNSSAGKNLIGAFHPPTDVYIDPDVLQTLPNEEWRNGLAELVKHAWIADAGLFKMLEENASILSEGPGDNTAALIQRGVSIKVEVVAEDPFEEGRRAILNAGHTIGHAIESASGHNIKHGFAVAAGLLVEAAIATRTVGLADSDSDRLQGLLASLRLIPETTHLTFEELLPYLKSDKKNVAGDVRFALPRKLGAMSQNGNEWTHSVNVESIQRVWEELR